MAILPVGFFPPEDSVRGRACFALLCVISIGGLVGCSEDEADQEVQSEQSTANQGNGGSKTMPASKLDSILFSPSETLTLSPGELTSLTVIAETNRASTVAFEILATDPAFDGFLLEASSPILNKNAQVELQAPTQPTSFMVRASLTTGGSTSLAVSVSSQGYGSLRIEPLYEGTRKIAKWTASARVGFTCEELENFWSQGALVGSKKSAPTISSIPSGPVLAITLRGDGLVSGCTTLSGVGADTTETVIVEVSDRPIDVESGLLDLTLSVKSTTTEFAAHLDEAIAQGVSTFRAEEASDAAALLQWMQAGLSTSEKNEFSEKITSSALSSLVQKQWNNQDKISDLLRSRLTDAASQIPSSDTFKGKLTLNGANSQFNLSSAAGVPSAVSGFFQGSIWNVALNSGDNLVLSGQLTYEPLRWLASIADKNAAMDAQEALNGAADCQGIALTLSEPGIGPIYGACEAPCVQLLCEETLSTLWRNISTSGNAQLSTLSIAASGVASPEGAAQVASFTGTWLGRFGAQGTSVKGQADGKRINN